MESAQRSRGSALRVVACTLLSALAGALAVLLARLANDPPSAWTRFFILYFAALGGACLAAAVLRWGALRSGVIGAALGGYLAVGVITVFSIGLPLLLLAVAPLAVVLSREVSTREAALAAGGGFCSAIATLALGFGVLYGSTG